MANSELSITISAKDQATAPILSVKAAIAGTAKETKKISEETRKSPEGFFNKFISGAKGAKEQLSGMKRVLEGSSLARVFTPIGAAMAIFSVGVQYAKKKIEDYYEELKRGATQAASNAAQLEKISAMMDRKRSADTESMRQLLSLSVVEKKSDVQKKEAARLVDMLNGRVKDLGLSYNELTGEVTGADGAMTKLLDSQKQQQIREIDGRIKQLQTEYSELNKIVSDASFAQKFKTGGRAGDEAKSAADKHQSLSDQLNDLRGQRRDLMRSDPEKDRTLAADAEIAKQQELLEIEKLRAAGREKEAARMEKLRELHAANINYSKEEKEKLLEINAELEKTLETSRQRAEEEQRSAASTEERRRLAEESEKFFDDEIAQAEYELELQKLKNAGLEDEADRLRLNNDLRQRGKELSEEDINTILAKRKALRELQSGSKDTRTESVNTLGRGDQFAQIGMYNFGGMAASNLDLERNRLLQRIAEKVGIEPAAKVKLA